MTPKKPTTPVFLGLIEVSRGKNAWTLIMKQGSTVVHHRFAWGVVNTADDAKTAAAAFLGKVTWTPQGSTAFRAEVRIKEAVS